ncbi:pentatricopeptide repeat-containing protein CRR2, chloroplastic-like [Apium graveolens]|uniref:pentatricopeptide repeat-containing protein CRR2, chloroplastic-like n=1 Tax=Apium graveolens TaxID=4045 RepID=UPI003D79F8C6
MLVYHLPKTLTRHCIRFFTHPSRLPSQFHHIPTGTNHLIQSLCQQGNLKQALYLLTEEPYPNLQTFELLIHSCSIKNSSFDARTVHNHVIHKGFDQNPFLATKLIGMYFELGLVDSACQVFDRICKRNVFVWNAFFKGLVKVGYGDEVLCMYRRMNLDGGGSDSFTYTYVLKGCVAEESEESFVEGLGKVKEIHCHILRHGYWGNVHVMTTLVDVYAKFGCVVFAGFVFYGMQVKNVVSWSAMIACCAKNGRPFEAVELFREMIVEIHGLVPNSVTMVSVIQACTALCAVEIGRLLHGYVLRKGLNSILPVVNALLSMYARCGDLHIGRRVFDQMERRDVVSWNSMISSYGINGLGKKAIEVFEEMLFSGIHPNPVSFVSVLGACSHGGLLQEGKILFESMERDHGVYPTVKHYACLVDLLGRANRLDEAAKVIENMQIEPGPTVWGSLLGSCRIHCNVKLAESASRRLFQLEPENFGNYSLMAEIYAQAEMWDEVKRIKNLIEARGIQKLAGCSWIEVKRRIYSFISADELSPKNEVVLALLVKLLTEIKKMGYVPHTKVVLFDTSEKGRESILLAHSEKLALAFGLMNTNRGETIRITKNLRLCEDCHSVTKFISKFLDREILVRDVNRIHLFKDGVCSCGDYW